MLVEMFFIKSTGQHAVNSDDGNIMHQFQCKCLTSYTRNHYFLFDKVSFITPTNSICALASSYKLINMLMSDSTSSTLPDQL